MSSIRAFMVSSAILNEGNSSGMHVQIYGQCRKLFSQVCTAQSFQVNLHHFIAKLSQIL